RDSSAFRQPPRTWGFTGFFACFCRRRLGCSLTPRHGRLHRRFWRPLGGLRSLNLAWGVPGAGGLTERGFPASGGVASRGRPKRRIGPRSANSRPYLGDRGHAVDHPQRTVAAIVIHKRRGLGLISRQTLLEDLRVVVGPQ